MAGGSSDLRRPDRAHALIWITGIVRPLLAPKEEAAQSARFGSWLDEALVQALAQWTRFL